MKKKKLKHGFGIIIRKCFLVLGKIRNIQFIGDFPRFLVVGIILLNLICFVIILGGISENGPSCHNP